MGWFGTTGRTHQELVDGHGRVDRYLAPIKVAYGLLAHRARGVLLQQPSELLDTVGGGDVGKGKERRGRVGN